MAASKLTLSADKDTIELAKTIASEDNISVSKLFKTLINEVAKKRKKKDPILEKYKDVKLSDDIIFLTGILKGKVPDDVDYREAYREHLLKKHGI